MELSKTDLTVIILGLVTILLAWFVDAILPSDILVTSLYIVPIALVSFWFGWRTILVFTILSLFVFTLEAVYEGLSALNYIFKEILFFSVYLMASQFSIHREKNAKLTKEAENARERQQLFMEMISHDLIQPITAVKLYTEQLVNRAKDRDDKLIDHLASAVNYLTYLVVDLRDAARAERGGLEIEPDQMDLIDLLDSVVVQQQTTTSIHHIRLENQEPVIGFWDQDRLRQLFTNLISNAIKYSPKGGDIILVVKNNSRYVLVSVSDNGIGLSAEQHKKLFQPFLRLHEYLPVKGTGLGLYICKAITQAHHGNIWAESQAEKGSTFFVRLPLTKRKKH